MATPRSNIVRLRLTDLEKADWQRAAGGTRMLSDWIRRVCNAAATGSESRGEQPRAVIADEVQVMQPRKKVSYETPGHTIVTKPIASSAECPRAFNHRPGVYCGTCKTVATKKGE